MVSERHLQARQLNQEAAAQPSCKDRAQAHRPTQHGLSRVKSMVTKGTGVGRRAAYLNTGFQGWEGLSCAPHHPRRLDPAGAPSSGKTRQSAEGQGFPSGWNWDEVRLCSWRTASALQGPACE